MIEVKRVLGSYTSLRLILIYSHLQLAALDQPGAKHAWSVETKGGLAVGGDGDDPAVPVQRDQLFMDHLVGGLL